MKALGWGLDFAARGGGADTQKNRSPDCSIRARALQALRPPTQGRTPQGDYSGDCPRLGTKESHKTVETVVLAPG